MQKVNDAVFDRRLLNHNASYQAIADAIDNPKAVRAANGRNPVAIIGSGGSSWPQRPRLRIRLEYQFRDDYFPSFAVEAVLVLRI